MLPPRLAPGSSRWIAACLLVLLGCGEPGEPGRVLLVGIDGASLQVIRPMIEQGRLPSLARIAEDGVHGTLRSFPPLESARIWTSIATGKSPKKHRILTFTRDRADGERRLVASYDRSGHALWNMLSGSGRSVGVVNWWVTYPPERIRGVMVSDHFLPGVVRGRMKYFRAEAESDAPVVFPVDWTPRIRQAIAAREGEDESAGPFADAVLPDWVRREKLSEWYLDDVSVGAIALEVEKELHPDVMLVLLKGVDAASHVLWATLDPPSQPLPGTAAELAAGAETLRRFYQQADSLLGALLEHYGPEDLVIVVSDHGFERRQNPSGLTGQHKGPIAMQAVIFARGPGIPEQGSVGNVTIHDITPTILAWLGMPIADDMDGRPAAFLRSPPTGRIASYDTAPIERLQTSSAGEEERIMEQLKALGYFEEESEGE